MSERQSVHLTRRCARTDRTLASGLQCTPSAQLTRQPDTERVCDKASGQLDFGSGEIPIADCLLTGPRTRSGRVHYPLCPKPGSLRVEHYQIVDLQARW